MLGLKYDIAPKSSISHQIIYKIHIIHIGLHLVLLSLCQVSLGHSCQRTVSSHQVQLLASVRSTLCQRRLGQVTHVIGSHQVELLSSVMSSLCWERLGQVTHVREPYLHYRYIQVQYRTKFNVGVIFTFEIWCKIVCELVSNIELILVRDEIILCLFGAESF